MLTQEGVYYYRIKSIDKDGRSNYSLVKSVLYKNAGKQIVVGPNPFTNSFTVGNMHNVKTVYITDLSGRTLFSKDVRNQSSTQIDAQSLPAGSYHLKILQTSGEAMIIKLVKQ